MEPNANRINHQQGGPVHLPVTIIILEKKKWILLLLLQQWEEKKKKEEESLNRWRNSNRWQSIRNSLEMITVAGTIVLLFLRFDDELLNVTNVSIFFSLLLLFHWRYTTPAQRPSIDLPAPIADVSRFKP